MITKNTFIIFIQLLTFCFSQSINIGSKTLEIGMDKKEVLEMLKNHIDLSHENLNRENFWIRNKNQIVGSIGFFITNSIRKKGNKYPFNWWVNNGRGFIFITSVMLSLVYYYGGII